MVNPNPIKDSKRSKRRVKRGFKDLATSSRKHRRAMKRLKSNGTIGANHNGGNGTYYGPGMRIDPPLQGKTKTFAERTAGALNYH